MLTWEVFTAFGAYMKMLPIMKFVFVFCRGNLHMTLVTSYQCRFNWTCRLFQGFLLKFPLHFHFHVCMLQSCWYCIGKKNYFIRITSYLITKLSPNTPTENMKRAQNSNIHNKKHKPERQLDPVFGQYRALPVSQEIFDSITPDTIPTDAETYLALVRKQAQEGSSVMFVRKEISYDEASSRVSSPVERRDELSQGQRDHYLEVLKEFKIERANLPIEGELPIPREFVFPNNFTEWRTYTMSHQPSLALISNLDHDLVFKLLIYVTKWLVHNTPLVLTKWIYALMVRVPELLDASEMAGVRELAKKALKVRNKECNDVSKFICDVVLVVCGEVFGQKDLFSL